MNLYGLYLSKAQRYHDDQRRIRTCLGDVCATIPWLAAQPASEITVAPGQYPRWTQSDAKLIELGNG